MYGEGEGRRGGREDGRLGIDCLMKGEEEDGGWDRELVLTLLQA